jgi:hypothetical protein
MKNIIITILMLLFSINLIFGAIGNTGNDAEISSTIDYNSDEYKLSINVKDNDNRQIECTSVYSPVCVELQVQCIKAPCPAVKETFSNSCEAGKIKLGKILYKGECEEKTEKDDTPYVKNMGIETRDSYVSIKTQTNIDLIFNYHDINDENGHSGRFTTGNSITELGSNFKYKVENGHEYSYSFQEAQTDKYLLKGSFSLPEITNETSINETNTRPIYKDQSDKFDIKYLFNEKTGQYTFYISLNETSLTRGQFKLDKQEYKSEGNAKEENENDNETSEPSKGFWNKIKFWS